MTDIHCHILHGMDDGAADLDESTAMAKMAQSEGLTHIVATAHFHPFKDDFEMFLEKRDIAINQLRDALNRENIPVKIISGAEVRMEHEFSKRFDLHKLCIGNSRHILVELSKSVPPVWFESELQRIKKSGFIPILAHTERIEYFGRNIKTLKRYVEDGLLVQINALSVTSFLFNPFRRNAKKIIKNNLAHFIATDAHNLTSRPPLLNKALNIAGKWSKGDLFDMADMLFE